MTFCADLHAPTSCQYYETEAKRSNENCVFRHSLNAGCLDAACYWRGKTFCCNKKQSKLP